MIRAHIRATHPPAFGLPVETIDLEVVLQEGFADTPEAAHARILRQIQEGGNVVIPVEGEPAVIYSSDVLEVLGVWDG